MISITAVIPCYNSSATIEQCLRSVFEQSEAVDEIIVIDDGSTDNSAEIIQQLFDANQSATITKIIKQSNSGPSAARNKGIQAARSTHIAFLDSDDEWYSDKIKKIKQLLEREGYDLVASVYNSAPLHYSGIVSFKRQLLKNHILTPCVVVRKDALLQLGGFNELMRHAEDYYLWLKLCYRHRVFVLDSPGARSIVGKRIFGDSGLSSNLRAMHQGVLTCYRALYKDKMISGPTYLGLYSMEKIKYLRRLWMTGKGPIQGN